MAGDHTNFFKTGAPLAASRLSDQQSIGNGNVADGNWHNVLVSWSATDHTLTYWFDGKQQGTLNQDIVAKYEGGSQYAYLGFTAGTGGAHNLQEVHLDSPDRLVRRPVAQRINGYPDARGDGALGNERHLCRPSCNSQPQGHRLPMRIANLNQ